MTRKSSMLAVPVARVVLAAAVLPVTAGIAAAQDQSPETEQLPEYDDTRPWDPLAPTDLQPGEIRRLDLTLDEARRLALQNDLGLEIQSVVTDVARFDYAGSWGAFDPVLTVGGSVTEIRQEGESFLSGGTVIKQNDLNFNTGLVVPVVTGGTFSFSFDHTNSDTNNTFVNVNPSTTDLVSLSFTQPLLRGRGREFATSVQREAELGYRQEIANYWQTRLALLSNVTNAYWDLVAAREGLDVAEVTLALGRRQLEQNQRRFDAGVGTEVDVLQAQANVAVRLQERLNAQVAVAEAVDALKQLLFPGKDERTWGLEIVPSTPLPEVNAADAVPWQESLAVALAERPELQRQRLEIEASEVRLARSRSERRPGLDLVLSAASRGFDGDPGTAFEKAVRFDFPTTSAGLNLSFPVGNRTARNAEHAARAALRNARLVYDQLETDIVREVRTAARQVLYQAEALEAARTSRDLSERQLDAEEARLREGLTTTFQVLQFQEQLAQSLLSERSAQVSYAKAVAELDAAEGVLGRDLR